MTAPANIWAGPPNRTAGGGGQQPPWLSPYLIKGPQDTAQQPASNIGQITSGINPRPIYDQRMTNAAVNNEVAQNAFEMPYALKQFSRPGMSWGAGTMSQAIPGMAQAGFNRMSAQANIPWQDAYNNEGSMLAGQTAREGDVLGQYSLLNQLTGLNNKWGLGQQGLANNDIGALLNMLQSMGV